MQYETIADMQARILELEELNNNLELTRLKASQHTLKTLMVSFEDSSIRTMYDVNGIITGLMQHIEQRILLNDSAKG